MSSSALTHESVESASAVYPSLPQHGSEVPRPRGREEEPAFHKKFLIPFNGNSCWAVRTPRVRDFKNTEEIGNLIVDNLEVRLSGILPAAQFPMSTMTNFVCVFGGAAGLNPGLMRVLKTLINDGILAVANALGSTIIDGGTDSGVMRLVGRSIASSNISIMGVCPERLCIYPGSTKTLDRSINYTCLESHHTHMVLVDSDEWGGETMTIYCMIKRFLKHAKGCAVLINGGTISKNEISTSVQAGIPIICIKGTLRLADELSAALARFHESGELPQDVQLRDIVRNGVIEEHDVNDSAELLQQKILKLLGHSPSELPAIQPQISPAAQILLHSSGGASASASSSGGVASSFTSFSFASSPPQSFGTLPPVQRSRGGGGGGGGGNGRNDCGLPARF